MHNLRSQNESVLESTKKMICDNQIEIPPPAPLPNLEVYSLECFNVLESKLGGRIGRIQWTELAGEDLVDRSSWLTVV